MMMKMLQDCKPSRYNTYTLQNTHKFDSVEIKNNQVSTNLIDKAIMDYHDELEDIFEDKIDKEIPYIDLVEDDNYKHDEGTTCRIYLNFSTIHRFQKFYEKKYETKIGISKEIRSILEKYLDEVETCTDKKTSSYIKYKNKTPRIDVSKKLLEIAREIKNNSTQNFSKQELLRIVERQENIGDIRTIKKYHDCLVLYSIKLNQANIAFDHYNMSGFYEGVLNLIKKREGGLNTFENPANSGDLRLKVTPREGIGVSPVIQQIIDETSKQTPALHDIRIKFRSKQLHENTVKAGKIPNKHNKGIFEKGFHVSKEITTNLAIYPNYTTIELACTYHPVSYDSKGAEKLLEHVTLIRNLLCKTYQVQDMPNQLEWTVVYYHLNQDGTIELSREQFHRKISNKSEKDVIQYAKLFPDGTQRMRSERIITPENYSLKNLLKNMQMFGN